MEGTLIITGDYGNGPEWFEIPLSELEDAIREALNGELDTHPGYGSVKIEVKGLEIPLERIHHGKTNAGLANLISAQSN